MSNGRFRQTAGISGLILIYSLWLALIAGYATFMLTELIPYSNHLRGGHGGLASGLEGLIAAWFLATAINIFTFAHSPE